jgi:hypothetical protein
MVLGMVLCAFGCQQLAGTGRAGGMGVGHAPVVGPIVYSLATPTELAAPGELAPDTTSGAPDTTMHGEAPRDTSDPASEPTTEPAEAPAAPMPPVEGSPPPSPASPSGASLCGVALALQALVEDRAEEALAILSQYPTQDQNVLLRLLPILARTEQGGLFTGTTSDEERQQVLEALRGLVLELQREAPLIITKAVFCREVHSFGRGQWHKHNHFRAGDRAAIYLEIENLSDEKTEADRYATRLSSDLRIYQGPRLVKTLPVQTLPDWSWSQRHDHFSVIRFQFPRDLEPGAYLLQVRLTDETTGRQVAQELPFRIVTVADAYKLPKETGH